MKRTFLGTFCLSAGLGALTLLACGQDIQPTEPAILLRPTDVTFACIGDLIVDPGGANERRIISAQPIESCRLLAFGQELPGQEDAHGGSNPPTLTAFVTQSSQGTVALLRTVSDSNVVLDSDSLTPGRNAIPIATLPIASVADESGCFLVTANAGTCDLATLDMTSASSILNGPQISRIPVTNASGEVIDAKPAAMIASAQTLEVGNECPATPTGTAYIAYPDCNLVAAVDLETGVIQGGIQFGEDGATTIVDGNVSCASQCGGGVPSPDAGPDASVDAGPDAGLVDAGLVDGGVDGGTPPPPPPTPGSDGAGQPISLDRDTVSNQLIIAATNSNSLVVATLDEAGLPTASRLLVAEGDVGFSRVKATDVIPMGGATGSPGGTAGDFQFVYGIASDRTIRVFDLNAGTECETQADPRFLRDENSVTFLSCIPVGSVDSPPRRATANSPGIALPRDAVPLDVEFSTFLRGGDGFGGPTDMAGTFAFVTSSTGVVFVINIDDDVYPDLEDNSNPEVTFLSQAIAHQLRDFATRNPIGAPDLDRDTLRAACALPNDSALVLPPRLRSGVLEFSNDNQINISKRYELPSLLAQLCEVVDDEDVVLDRAFLNELAFSAPVLQREMTFPDLAEVNSELWSVAWQGPLSRDSSNINLDGQPIRTGVLQLDSTGAVSLIDNSSPFCEMGAEPFDILQLVGCDPSQGDTQCGLGEECFVHPEAPATLERGTCLPSERTDILAVQCRDFLVGNKTYSITETNKSALTLRTRRRVLKTSPLDGCVSDAQCSEMSVLDRLLRTEQHPIEADMTPTESDLAWRCAADPSRASALSSCQLSCETSDDCGGGLSCESGFCVAGPLPPAECTIALHRYQVNGGEALVVVGSTSGFLHRRVADPDTGECVTDPDANPLLTGRIPLRVPPCSGDGFEDISPNPCQVDLSHDESYSIFEIEDSTCELAEEPFAIRSRDVSAIRFNNPTFRFHLADLLTTGDASCRNDRAGTYPLYSTVHNGFEIGIDLTGGFVPMFLRASDGNPVDLRLPKTLKESFDGRIWILDQGDLSAAIQGRVLTFEPGAASSSFNVSSFDLVAN